LIVPRAGKRTGTQTKQSSLIRLSRQDDAWWWRYWACYGPATSAAALIKNKNFQTPYFLNSEPM
jgi:hypothetical protein